MRYVTLIDMPADELPSKPEEQHVDEVRDAIVHIGTLKVNTAQTDGYIDALDGAQAIINGGFVPKVADEVSRRTLGGYGVPIRRESDFEEDPSSSVNPQACAVGVQTTGELLAYESEKCGPIDLMAPSVTLDVRT